MRTLYLSIIAIAGIVIPLSLLGNHVFADNANSSMASINVQIDKSNPDKPQIMITGTVYKIFSPILVIIVSDPFDQKLAISQLTPSTDGHFSETLFAAGPLWIKSGNYSVSVMSSSQQLAQAKFYYDGTKPCCIIAGPLHIDSPLKQFKSGTASKDITCRLDLLLIFKSSNEAPICIKPDNAKKLESRGWAISQYHDPGAKPKIKMYDYSYDGIDKDNGIVSINNQTFYQTTLGYSAYDIPKKSSTSFHDVVFAFPQGSLNTPGASFVMLDMKFQDGFEEIYGGTALVQNGTVTKIGGIPIPTQYGPHVATDSITILGNHTMPQAGITIYHDIIKLLVSADQLSTEDNNVVNNTAQVVPQCLTHILNQTVFSGYAGVLSCPIMGYHVSSEMENYTGFHEISDTLYTSSVVGPNTYVGTLQEELDKSGNGRMEKNLVLEPGHNATITYKITLHTMKCNGECPDKFNFPTQANLTNDVELVHRENNEMSYSHEGLVVKYDQPSESLVDGQTVTLMANIYASKDVPRGTYWLILVPGNCVGGPLILLTVSDCEK